MFVNKGTQGRRGGEGSFRDHRLHAELFIEVYRANVEQLAPVIISVLPLAYRDRVVKHDNFALRIAKSVKEDAEAIQAVVLKAPKQERWKEISESIVAKYMLDGPDSVAPIMAMVTTMLSGAL
ncbi:toxin YdaT family protein [Leclercia tamurae]|uniref:toxin YdaT family protein n=1 Tax=Leclercia tamurae TaxID=2926467 RepID=UPI0036F46170